MHLHFGSCLILQLISTVQFLTYIFYKLLPTYLPDLKMKSPNQGSVLLLMQPSIDIVGTLNCVQQREMT